MTYEIKYGVTVDYLITGLAIIFVGVILLILKLFFVAPIFIIIGLVVFLSIKGMTINKEFEQLKVHYWFFGYKYGKWISIESYDVLVLTNHFGETVMSSRGVSNHVQTNSYGLILMNKQNQKIELKEYETYKKALSALGEISEFLQIESVDKVKVVREMINNRGVRR